MSGYHGGGRGGGGGGRGAYYKAKYGGGGRGGRGGRRGGGGGHHRGGGHGGGYGNGGGYDGGGATSGLPVEANNLRDCLCSIDGRQYPCYKDLTRGDAHAGGWSFERFILHFDRIQGDAYAPPSRCRAIIPPSVANFPPWSFEGAKVRRVALADYLARHFVAAARTAGVSEVPQQQGGGWGGSKGGALCMERMSPFVLERTSVIVKPDGEIHARFTVALPARGRSIMGRYASDILCAALPALISGTLLAAAHDAHAIKRYVDCIEDQQFLSAQLEARGLVAFVPDGAVLPRASGASQEPMPQDKAVPFSTPPEYACAFDLPHHGRIHGMGIPKGVTLIVGGGFHGKSTLLKVRQYPIPSRKCECKRKRTQSCETPSSYSASDPPHDLLPLTRALMCCCSMICGAIP